MHIFFISGDKLIKNLYFIIQCTFASKFLTLTEAVRDAADLYLSLKYPPMIFICDSTVVLQGMLISEIQKWPQLYGITTVVVLRSQNQTKNQIRFVIKFKYKQLFL